MIKNDIEYVLRPLHSVLLEDLDFDDDGGASLSKPELVRVPIPGLKYPVDFGAWCYTDRRKSSTNPLSELSATWLVNPTSFRPKRRYLIRHFLAYLTHHLAVSKSPKSLSTKICHFRLFISWSDNFRRTGLDSFSSVNKLLIEYSEHLHRRVQLGELSINTAAAYQRDCHQVLVHIFDDDLSKLTQGTRRLSKSFQATVVTQPPLLDDARKVLGTSLCLFTQLSDLVIDGQKFPKKIDLPGESLWMFPTPMPFRTKARLDSPPKNYQRYLAYDYATGSILGAKEISKKVMSAHTGNIYLGYRIRKQALEKIEKSNRDLTCERRIFAASLAAQSFINLFGANTGMGLGNIASLEWSDEYVITKEVMGFKTIKPRAGQKEVTFHISSNFFPKFKRYLELRRYILKSLNVKSFKFLFFSFKGGEMKPVVMDFSHNYNKRLSRLFDIDIKITMRQWRALKSDWLIAMTDLPTAALVLQNTIGTVAKHYAAGSELKAAEELDSYFSQYKQQLVAQSGAALQSIPTGSCSEYRSPQPISETAAVKPDCKIPEGCLFCIHYRIHPDHFDLKKLLSYAYVLEVSSHIASNNEPSNLVRSTLDRVQELIGLVRKSEQVRAVAFEQAHNEVFEHEDLDHYWGKKLTLLTELELL